MSADAFNAFGKYYSENKIFIETDLCTKIEQLMDVLQNAFIEFDIAQIGENYHKDVTGGWVNAFKIVKDTAGPIIEELEEYFRKIVSISENKITGNQ